MDTNIKKKYAYWEWRTIIVLIIGYILYYFVRKNFSIAIPAMEQELGLSKVQLGTFLMLNGIIYGFSRFVNGILVDRYSKKLIMATGLLLSAIVNLVICFSPQMNGFMNLLDTEGKATMGLVYLIGSLWVLNGYLQGMGVPPCVSLMVHWIKPSQLATKQSIWNVSHSVGAGAVAILCGFILQKYSYSAWNLCFAIPAAIALAGVPIIFFGLKDKPSSVGLPTAVELDEAEGNVTEIKKEHKLSGENFKKVVNKMVFKNKYIWILAVTNFCIYIIRFTILDWGSSILTQYKGMDISTAGSVVGASELVGGILGMLVAGWVTDKVFKSCSHKTCFFCCLGVTISFFLFWQSTNLTLSILFIILSSFFVYGPQALLGVSSSQQASKYATGTAGGILGIFGYISTAISGPLFGHLADSQGGWNLVFIVAIVFGVIGTIVIAMMWNAPANGEAEVEKYINQLEQPNATNE